MVFVLIIIVVIVIFIMHLFGTCAIKQIYKKLWRRMWCVCLWLHKTTILTNTYLLIGRGIKRGMNMFRFLKHDQVCFLCPFQVFIWRIKMSRTLECLKIWRRLLNIVPAEIAVNVLIGCLYIGMRDYIYSPRDYIYNPANVN